MSALRAALDDYLRIRRRLGFAMPQDGRMLEGFVEFLDRAGAQRITTESALAWARLPVDVHPFTWRQRLTVARGFARYLATVDPASEVPATDLLPGRRPRIAPYVYSEQEIAALMAAARQLRPALRAARHETLIGLLAVTGCRPGEALGLDRGDVDLDTAWCTCAPGRTTNSGRCRCTRAPSARFAPTPACVTPASRHRPRRRSSCPRGDGGWDARSSTPRSSRWSARSGWKAVALVPAAPA